MKPRHKVACPKCGEQAGLAIVYGYPSRSLIKNAKRDEVILGGCVVEIDAPNRHCQHCQHRWIDDHQSVRSIRFPMDGR